MNETPPERAGDWTPEQWRAYWVARGEVLLAEQRARAAHMQAVLAKQRKENPCRGVNVNGQACRMGALYGMKFCGKHLGQDEP
jgi:hypothetical protein